MYIVIVGAGDIGIPLIDIATQSETRSSLSRTISERADQVAGEYDCLVLNDDATAQQRFETLESRTRTP